MRPGFRGSKCFRVFQGSATVRRQVCLLRLWGPGVYNFVLMVVGFNP